jgi:hypothetical protein
MVKKFFVCGVSAAVAIAVACGGKPGNPLSPSATSVLATGQAPDGSTLKATAPTPLSPIGGIRLLEDFRPALVVRNSTGEFVTIGFAYRFQLFRAGTLVVDSGPIGQGDGSTSWRVTSDLESDKEYVWRARAELETGVGPWSADATFLSPERVEGYIRGNELYDPLINGKTIGQIHGPVTFIPGLGVRLETQLSYISYQLEQTLTEGEFSIIVTGMPANTEGNKTKLFAMGEGYSDIVTNDRRMTVEKRGDPPGVIAWRFITHDDQVDTEGPDRVPYDFKENLTYFWQATWRANVFRLIIRENATNGVDGAEIYNKGKAFQSRPYDPNPHVIYIGAPVGRSGEGGASVDRAIIRHVWVSSRPRPGFANQ